MIVGGLALALGACAYQPPAIDNPEALPPRALGLYDAVLNGCLPYVSGDKSEPDAMAAIGMYKSLNIQNPLTSPDLSHRYRKRPPSPVKVQIETPASTGGSTNPVCRVRVDGNEFDAYKRAADLAFEARFGADFAAVSPQRYGAEPSHDYDRAFCRDGLLLYAYRDRYKDDVFYQIEVIRPARPKGIAPICGK
jgi:hypothetical protein